MSAALSYPGDVVRLDGVREVVQPACGHTTWKACCVSCAVALPSPFYTELHTREGAHIVARWCPIHGPEATA